MPYIHQHECEKHGQRVENIGEEFVMVDVDVHGRALAGGEFDDAEDYAVLR